MTATDRPDDANESNWSVSEPERGCVDLPLGRLFDALKHPRRRYTLYYLAENGTASLSELGEQVATWERQREDDAPEPERICTSLYHTHIPQLSAIGLVEYDRERGAVRETARTERIDRYLRFTAQYEFDAA